MGQGSVKNFGIVTVSIGYDAAATSVVLTAGQGAKLPSPSTDKPMFLVWWDSTTYADPASDPNAEVIKCTARSTDTLTIVRGQEGSGATTKNTVGKTYKMLCGFTSGMYDSIYTDHRFPQCGRFEYNTTTECLFKPRNGNRIIINGVGQTIPDAGVSFPNTSLAIDTTYYAYVFMSAGVMTKEFSATAYAVEVGTGVIIKSGDSTRTLVGMVRTVSNAGTPNFADTEKKRFVISWFNRRPRNLKAPLLTNQASSSTSYAFFAGDLTVGFVTWADSPVPWALSMMSQHNTVNGRSYAAVRVDGASAEDGTAMVVHPVTGDPYGSAAAIHGVSVALADGYHYYDVMGKTQVGTVTWIGAAGTSTPDRAVLAATVQG